MLLGRTTDAKHHLTGSYHFHFDNSLEPALTVVSGDTVVFRCQEAYGGELTPESTTEDMSKLEFDRVHCLTGPVAVEGAEPGDVLEVEVLDFGHDGWAWTALFPGIGLLAEDFGDLYHLKIWRVGADERAELVPGIRVPVEPFCGVMGVALRRAGGPHHASATADGRESRHASSRSRQRAVSSGRGARGAFLGRRRTPRSG